MSMYLGDDDKYVLSNIPSPTSDNFLNITRKKAPGIYLVGSDKYYAADFTIADIFHRQIGPADEIILGILSVFVISIIAELVQTVLLRTRGDRKVFAKNLLYATLIDEFAHFRNIWSNMRRVFSTAKKQGTYFSKMRQSLMISLIVLFVTAAVFTADVVAVIVTQPKAVESKKTDYNIQGFHPAGTYMGRSKFIRRTSLERTCVSPVAVEGHQQRNFAIHVCFNVTSDMALSSENDFADVFKVGSWYHRGGSDHEILFGNSMYRLQMRADLFVTGSDSTTRRITFQNIDTSEMQDAFYIQRRFMYAVMEWYCNEDFERNITTEERREKCEGVLLDLREDGSEKQEQNIRLWRAKKEYVDEKVIGLVSTFRVGIHAPSRAVDASIRDMVTSAVIMEVKGPAAYERVTDDVVEDGIVGLLSEEGRIAGVTLIAMVLICLMSLLFLLRYIFQPISLAAITLGQMDDEYLTIA